MGTKLTIYYTPTFAERFKKLPKKIILKAYRKETIFRQDQFQLSLKTHKLSGKLKVYWSFSIDYRYRIVFRFLSKNEILFVDVGTNEVYR